MKVKREDLVFIGYDSWCRAVYKVNSRGTLLKDINLKPGVNDIMPDIPEPPYTLYTSADGTFEGEPNNPVELEDDEE